MTLNTIKKLLLITSTVILTAMNTQAVFAVSGFEDLLPKESIDASDTSTTTEEGDTITGGELDESLKEKISHYQNLPDVKLESVFTTVIKTVLFLAGSLLTVGLIVVGIMYLVSAGNEEAQTKAKKILTYLGLGIIVISVSYALVAGIMQINLFK